MESPTGPVLPPHKEPSNLRPTRLPLPWSPLLPGALPGSILKAQARNQQAASWLGQRAFLCRQPSGCNSSHRAGLTPSPKVCLGASARGLDASASSRGGHVSRGPLSGSWVRPPGQSPMWGSLAPELSTKLLGCSAAPGAGGRAPRVKVQALVLCHPWPSP